jgi:triosephosphate isomerase
MTRRKMAAGNWKMNGLAAMSGELDALIAACAGTGAEVLICPPATMIAGFAARARGSAVTIGAQDCHAAASGAHTGDISAEMIADAGGTHIIVGHSERRADHGESDGAVLAKAEAAWRAGLTAIVQALAVVGGQLAGSVPEAATPENLVVAYEPVWAIGTGRTPSLGDIAEMHDFMRARLAERFGPGIGEDVRLLYGGSVKPGNAAEIFAVSNVDGGLVGGASLKASDFSAIVAAAG